MQQCLNMLQGDTKPIRKLVEVRFDEIKTITESKSPVLDMELSDWSVGEGGGQDALPEAGDWIRETVVGRAEGGQENDPQHISQKSGLGVFRPSHQVISAPTSPSVHTNVYAGSKR